MKYCHWAGLFPLLLLFVSVPLHAAERQTHLVPMEYAILQTLDKVTARVQQAEVLVGGAPLEFGSLSIWVRACHKAPPEYQPESVGFLYIQDKRAGQEPREIFSGWMFASSPGLSTLEHAIYDVWVLDCKKASSNGSSSPQ